MVAEYASTETLAHMASVRTGRPWKTDARVRIKSSQGEPRSARQGGLLPDAESHTFALGLEFLARTRDWLLPTYRPLKGSRPNALPCRDSVADKTRFQVGGAYPAILASPLHFVSKFSIHEMKCSGEYGHRRGGSLE